VALARLVYDAFATGDEDDPGPAHLWTGVIRDNEAAGAAADPVVELVIGDDNARRKAPLERRFGVWADAFLTAQGIVTDDESRWRVVEALPRAMTQAAKKLRRNADGDSRPDPEAGRFPAWKGRRRRPPTERSPTPHSRSMTCSAVGRQSASQPPAP
jgi:hypothetical protein